MYTAKYKNKVLAESDSVLMIEGNVYFPKESVNMEYFEGTETQTSCPWKGVASYYTVSVDGETLEDGAWYYPEPKVGASDIVGDQNDKDGDFTNYVAFYTNKGIEVSES